MTKIETLVFDFGQVVGFFDHGRTFRRLEPYSDMTPDEMFEAVYASDLEDEFESGRISEQEFLIRVKALCGLRCTQDEIGAAVADIFWPNDELCALIPQLKQRYRLVLGSNTNAVHARRFLVQFADTLSHFHGLVLSHKVGARKPARPFFEEVVRVADCPAERCVFIDDLTANVAGARACGLQGIVFTNVEGLRKSLRELRVEVN